MHVRVVAIRIVALGLCALTLASACSSSKGSPAAAPTSTTTDYYHTPNSIPFVVGDRIGLPNDWLVRVAAVHYPNSVPGLKAISASERYVVIDLTMQYVGTESHSVDANKLFTLTDSFHNSHYLVVPSGSKIGIDGSYAQNTSRSGQLVFTAPKQARLGLILYGPQIGTKISYFAIDPPTLSQQ